MSTRGEATEGGGGRGAEGGLCFLGMDIDLEIGWEAEINDEEDDVAGEEEIEMAEEEEEMS